MEHNNGMKPMRRRRFLSVALLSVPAFGLLAAGCGGGGEDSNGGGRGRVAVAVRWPEQATRLVPAASQSVIVRLLRGGTPVAQQVAARPGAGGGTVNVLFENVEVGDLTMTASAHPDANGGGVAQAQGSVPVAVRAGRTVEVRLTMGSTIDRIDVTPAEASLLPGESVQLVATPRNAAGEVVLVSAATLSWAVAEGGAIAAVSDAGRVTAQAAGAARVTVTETESGKAGAADVTVRPFLANEALWPRFHGGPRNDGYKGRPTITGGRLWNFRPKASDRFSVSSPAIGADNTVYVPSDDARLFALNGFTGEVRWSFEARSGEAIPPMGSPSIAPNGVVFVVGDGGTLYALNGGTGDVLWERDANFEDRSCPAVGQDGTVYAVRYAGGGGRTLVVALDPANGEPRWEKQIGEGFVEVRSSPALGPNGGEAGVDAVYVIVRDGFGYALAQSDGALLWGRQVGELPQYESSPAIAEDGTLVIGSPSGDIYALRPRDGSEVWEVVKPRGVRATPAIGPNNTAYVVTQNGPMYALDVATGAEKWAFAPVIEGEVGATAFGRSSPAVAGDATSGLVYVCGTDGVVHAVNVADGQEVWSQEVAGGVSSSPAIGADGRLYVSTQGGGSPGEVCAFFEAIVT